MFFKDKTKRNFTISDFLFSILFIGLMAIIIATALWYIRNIFSEKQNIDKIKAIQESLEVYYDKNAEYPHSLEEISDQDFLNNQSIFKYTPLGYNNICTGYHLGIVVGMWHRTLLKNDADFYSEKVCGTSKKEDFYGASRGCVYHLSEKSDIKDTCYDVLMKP